MAEATVLATVIGSATCCARFQLLRRFWCTWSQPASMRARLLNSRPAALASVLSGVHAHTARSRRSRVINPGIPHIPHLRTFQVLLPLLSSAEVTSGFILLLDFLKISAIVRSCTTRLAIVLTTSLLVLMVPCFTGKSPGSVYKGRNVIIFVADGLRNTSVSETDTPTMFHIRTEGVYSETAIHCSQLLPWQMLRGRVFVIAWMG